ncbi:MAG: hypothetical protein Q8O19_01165 [Rectinemataceae bacterium]|nr:hypothetical protein [Rectinemataceae bacterium]
MIIEQPTTVLVDNCINSLSDTMQGISKAQEFVWGDTIQKVNIAGYERRPMPNTDQIWKRKQIECLPTVGRIAREGKIEFYTYSELRHEAWKRPGSFPSNIIGDLFADVPFKRVDAAVERSFFFQMDISEYISANQMIKFCKWLLDSKVASLADLADRLGTQERYPAFLLNNLRGVRRFHDLCNGLAEKQYPDAFHLWTAEVNGIKYFLTTDQKFIRVMTETKRLNLPCRPLSPSDLLDVLKIDERDPSEYEANQFFNVFGEPN